MTRYRYECVYGCGWHGIWESDDLMKAKARDHYTDCSKNPLVREIKLLGQELDELCQLQPY